MTAELRTGSLARQALRATGGDGSHMAVEDAVSAQFGAEIPAFSKPTFERLRRARHAAQYFDPSAAPLTASDAIWAIEKAKDALSGSESAVDGNATGTVQLVIRQGQPDQRAACDRVVEGAGSRL